MALIALAIRLDSPGPVFFRQRRHGFNQEEIVVWKFRSMRVGADSEELDLREGEDVREAIRERGADCEIVLADEVLTPDSSRYWPADAYRIGTSPPSYDKQFVRDWLTSPASGWDKSSGEQPPALPDDIVAATRAKYIEAYEALTGRTFA